MTLKEAIINLAYYNDWRQGEDIPAPTPKNITETINVIIDHYKYGGKAREVTIPLSQELIDETTTEEMKLLSKKMEEEIFNPSSVDWLVEKLGRYNEEIVFLYQNQIEHAKAIHQDQMKQFAIYCMCNFFKIIKQGDTIKDSVNKFYDEKFKK